MVVTVTVVTLRTLMGELAATDPNPRQEPCQPCLTTQTRGTKGVPMVSHPSTFLRRKPRIRGLRSCLSWILIQIEVTPNAMTDESLGFHCYT